MQNNNYDNIFMKNINVASQQPQGQVTDIPFPDMEVPQFDNQPQQPSYTQPQYQAQPIQQKQEMSKPKKDMGQMLAQNMLNQVAEYTKMSGEAFNENAKKFAVDIITSANQIVIGNNYNWNQIDLVGCGFINQVKRWSQLGITMQDNLWVDIRNNSKTGMKDITIKAQYQTIEKIMTMYFKKPIKTFKTEVLCEGDEFATEYDYSLGEDKVTKFVPNKEIDRNKLENITGAFKIVFYYDTDDSNKIKQIVCQIDKNRIMRAYNASPSKDKSVWKQDTQKMVKKTVTWEMFGSDQIRPFMDFDKIKNNIGVVAESEQMDWNKETKNKNVIDVQTEVKESISNKGEKLNL